MSDRLYVVLDGTLPPGLQLSQALHAARAFAAAHPEREAAWYARSNTVAVLSAADGDALAALAQQARALDVPLATFREPDLGGRLTAIAVGPGADAGRLCRGLPLALG